MKLFVDAAHLSPYAMSAYVALVEKALPFEMQSLDLQQAQQDTPSYRAVSTTRRVPSLVDGAFCLSESSAIAEYLHEAYPGNKLYPDGVRDRAKAREIQAWLRSDLGPLRQERSTEVVFLGREVQPLSAAASLAAGKLIEAVDRLLPTGLSNLFGEWCIADTDLALMLNRLVLAGDAVPPRLAHYAQLQWQRPSVQAWVELSR